MTRTDYQLIDISEDGFVCLHIMVYFLVLFFCLSLKWYSILQVSLLTENGNTKDDLRLPTDDNLLTQVNLSNLWIICWFISVLDVVGTGYVSVWDFWLGMTIWLFHGRTPGMIWLGVHEHCHVLNLEIVYLFDLMVHWMACVVQSESIIFSHATRMHKFLCINIE